MHDTGYPMVDIGGPLAYIRGSLDDTGGPTLYRHLPYIGAFWPAQKAPLDQHRRPPDQCKEALDDSQCQWCIPEALWPIQEATG